MADRLDASHYGLPLHRDRDPVLGPGRKGAFWLQCLGIGVRLLSPWLGWTRPVLSRHPVWKAIVLYSIPSFCPRDINVEKIKPAKTTCIYYQKIKKVRSLIRKSTLVIKWEDWTMNLRHDCLVFP